MKRTSFLKMMTFLFAVLICLLVAAGCGETETTSSGASETLSESEESSAVESSVGSIEISEIIIEDDSSEPEESSKPYVPGAYEPYRSPDEIFIEKLPLAPLPVENLTMKTTTLTGEIGDRMYIELAAKPIAARPRELLFGGYDPEIVSVDEYGLVSFLKAGETTVTVTADGKAMNCKVKVTEVTEKSVLRQLIKTIVGADDYQHWTFGFCDFDGDGIDELIAQTAYTESGVPRADLYRISDGTKLFSLDVGSVWEKWTVRSGSFATRFVYLAYTQYPSMSGAVLIREALTVVRSTEEGKAFDWKVVRLAERTTMPGGGFSYCAYVDGVLASCDKETFRRYVQDEYDSRFERDNHLLTTVVFCSGKNAAEIETALHSPIA